MAPLLRALLLEPVTFALLAGLSFWPLEQLFAAHDQPRRERVSDLWFASVGQALVQLALLSVLGGALSALSAFALAQPLSSLLVSADWRPACDVALGLLVFEAMGYGYHRLAHSLPCLWRLHAVHHSSTSLDWLASFRQHPLEIVLMTLVQNAPLVLLDIPLTAHAGVLLLLRLNTVFVHANLTLPRQLVWLLATPAFHHRHHQRDGASANFASLFPWLDRAFGSYSDERAQTFGLREPSPRGFFALLLRPFAFARPVVKGERRVYLWPRKGGRAMAETKRGKGQTALITGASMGIGVDLAECFAQDGYELILTARSEPALKQVASRLTESYGVKTTVMPLDLGVQGGGAELARKIGERGLGVDVLVNNAGFGHAGALAGAPLEAQLGMVDLNIRALVELTHVYWSGMLAKGRGGVLNVASTAAFQPGPLMAVYYASKAFVLSFSEALWEEASGTGVLVSCLCPGATKSNFRARAGTGATRLSRMGAPMESAPVARQGYDGFQKNRRVVITGVKNLVGARAVPFIPRERVLKIVRNLQSPA